LEAFWGKRVFLGVSREILEFFGVVGWSLVQKTGLLRNLEIFWGFCGFLECLDGLGPICKYFSKTDGPAGIFTNI
jgi:hypothetical protein